MARNDTNNRPWIELQALLDRDGITQRQLARESGLSPQYVNDMIRGRVAPSPRARKTFADVLRVPVALLLPPEERGSEYGRILAALAKLPGRDERPRMK